MKFTLFSIPLLLFITFSCVAKADHPLKKDELPLKTEFQPSPSECESKEPSTRGKPQYAEPSSDDIMDEFSEDLSELYEIYSELGVSPEQYSMPMSKETREQIKETMKKLVNKLDEMTDKYKENSPIILKGFSINIPWQGVTVNFEIEWSRL